MRVVVIGAGAAGLVAATEAAKQNAQVLLLEKNNKIGVKILMSGGTRCNITHDTDAKGITTAFGHAKRFLQPCVGAFSPADVVQMFQNASVPTKVESTGKIFPVSDRAIDVRDALAGMAVNAGVEIRTGTAVLSVEKADRGWEIVTAAARHRADRVIVTAGGKSYPGCGTSGDAYQWLANIGHTIVTPRPALVPLVGGYNWTHELSGISVEDCLASVQTKVGGSKKSLAQRRGSWLFTHFGFSGPAAMDVSGAMTAADSFDDVRLSLDLIPRLSRDQLCEALTDRSVDGGRRRISWVLGNLLPSRLATAIVQQVGQDDIVAELPRAKLQRLVESLKQLSLPISGTRGFEKAEVTAGGVRLQEVHPRTMSSRIADGLFIAGEVLNVDGPIGGYNFQAAFSTGRAAGIASVVE